MNAVVSFYKKGLSSDVLAILLDAEGETHLSKEVLLELLIFCHGSDDLKDTIEEEVAEVFGDAVEQITTQEYSEENLHIALAKAKALEIFIFDDLLCLIQEESQEKKMRFGTGSRQGQPDLTQSPFRKKGGCGKVDCSFSKNEMSPLLPFLKSKIEKGRCLVCITNRNRLTYYVSGKVLVFVKIKPKKTIKKATAS